MKTKRKRFFSLALALTLCLGLVGCDGSTQPTAAPGGSPSVQATPSPEPTATPESTPAPVHDLSTAEADGFVIEAGVLKDYTGPNSDVFIPEGIIVVSGFFFKPGIRSLHIPSSAKEVNTGGGCENLETVEFAAGKELVVRNDAFSSDKSLTTVLFAGDGPLEIINHSFNNCENLTTVSFGEDRPLKIINDCFKDCGKLASITFPEGTTEISGFNRTGLTEVTFPKSVTAVSGFNLCEQLSSVTFAEGVNQISGFANCQQLTSVTISNGDAEIGGSNYARDVDGQAATYFAFEDCPNLTIHAPAGGAVEDFAIQHNIPFSPL